MFLSPYMLACGAPRHIKATARSSRSHRYVQSSMLVKLVDVSRRLLRSSDYFGSQRALGSTFFTLCQFSPHNFNWFNDLGGSGDALLQVEHHCHRHRHRHCHRHPHCHCQCHCHCRRHCHCQRHCHCHRHRHYRCHCH